jgi:hypothetical protein
MGLESDERWLKGEADSSAHDCHNDCNHGWMSVIAEQ